MKVVLASSVFALSLGWAQTAPPSADPKCCSIHGATVSALIDGYYSFGFNHPATQANQLRNFDLNSNQFSLNMAKVAVEYAPAPVGFRFDLGFGKAFDVIQAAGKNPEAFRYIEQAYVSFKPAATKGLEVDFGRFVTSAGAEVIETNSNWNYSRSLLFALAIPYNHFGLRTSFPVTKQLTAGFQLVNGWNNVEDNNTGKTIGFTTAWTTSKFTWSNNYYAGPEKNDINKGWRQLYDTTLLLTPSSKTSFYINYDYGQERLLAGGHARWTGVAGAARFNLRSWLALSPRLEWFNDADGWATTRVQRLKEATLTAEWRMHPNVLSRLEYRHDWSNERFFDRGATPAASRNQDTVLLGLVAYFPGTEK